MVQGVLLYAFSLLNMIRPNKKSCSSSSKRNGRNARFNVTGTDTGFKLKTSILIKYDRTHAYVKEKHKKKSGGDPHSFISKFEKVTS
jgi:hypothetical protein